MSNIFGVPKAGGPSGMDETRTVPTGDTVGSYTSYLDAQKAVDYLADQQFPVHMVSIVGNDLKMVERVTGRLSYPRVALSGALSGMWFGLFVGVMLSFFAPSPGYFSILTSVLMGAAFFMLFGIVTYAMQRGKRDFTSTSQVVATTYHVVVSPEAAFEARRLLQQLPMTRSDAAAGTGMYGQSDYRNQPYQQSGQGPARPAGWKDPYGQAPGNQVSGTQTPGNQIPGNQVPGGTGPNPVSGYPAGQYDQAGQQQPVPAPSRAFRYPDLPDGRPQYGIRLPQAPDGSTGQAPAAQETANGQATHTQAPAGQPGPGGYDGQPNDQQQGDRPPAGHWPDDKRPDDQRH